jgi:EAL domain-containing protein (putative c-di-GMP-specific phosphodiesterase class I)
LSMKVVAEGIETLSTARLVGQHAIEYGQGYLYGRPAPLAEIRRVPYALGA